MMITGTDSGECRGKRGDCENRRVDYLEQKSSGLFVSKSQSYWEQADLVK